LGVLPAAVAFARNALCGLRSIGNHRLRSGWKVGVRVDKFHGVRSKLAKY
jgi:hypothetical protein